MVGKCSTLEPQPQSTPFSCLDVCLDPISLHTCTTTFSVHNTTIPQIWQIMKRMNSSPFYSNVDWLHLVVTFLAKSWGDPDHQLAREREVCPCLPFLLPPSRSRRAPSWGSILMILLDTEFLLKALPLKTMVGLRSYSLHPHNGENLYSNHSSNWCCDPSIIHPRHRFSLGWKPWLLGGWSLYNPISHLRLCLYPQ